MSQACSVVLYGWQAGRPIPAGALAALTAIEPPLAVEQAKEVFELFEAPGRANNSGLAASPRDAPSSATQAPSGLRRRCGSWSSCAMSATGSWRRAR